MTAHSLPRRVRSGDATRPDGWPLYDRAALRAMEARAALPLPPHTLMRRAGASVARLALALAPHAEHIWIVAGRGNNGGDGIEAAIALAAAGKRVNVALEPARARPADAQAALERARGGNRTARKSDGAATARRP